MVLLDFATKRACIQECLIEECIPFQNLNLEHTKASILTTMFDSPGKQKKIQTLPGNMIPNKKDTHHVFVLVARVNYYAHQSKFSIVRRSETLIWCSKCTT